MNNTIIKAPKFQDAWNMLLKPQTTCECGKDLPVEYEYRTETIGENISYCNQCGATYAD